MEKESTALHIGEPSSAGPKGGMVMAAREGIRNGGFKRGLGILDFVLRIAAIISLLVGASYMGTSEQDLPFFSQSFTFSAGYDDLNTTLFFIIAMAITAGYLILTLPFSIVTIVRPRALGIRLLLLILDTAAAMFSTSAAAASSAIVYLAHQGNADLNWFAICQQYGDFCVQVSGSVVSGFVGAVFVALLILVSGVILRYQ